MNEEARNVGIIGADPLTEMLFELLKRIAPNPYSILINGETGVGKEVVANAIHLLSDRAKKPFFAINCAGLSESLAESELFGHERGAFTGASSARAGAFETAEGGTLFLDEIGDLPLAVQQRLLRAIEAKEVRRVGSDRVRKINVRLISATHKDLAEEVEAKRFREDLMFRLVSSEVKIHPLRNRMLDVPPLCEHFLKQIRIDLGPKVLTAAALNRLMEHHWPGNARELRTVLQNAASLVTPSVEISPESIQPRRVRLCTNAQANPKHQATPKPLRLVSDEAFIAELERSDWNRRKTARNLGIVLSTVKAKIKKLGLKDPNRG